MLTVRFEFTKVDKIEEKETKKTPTRKTYREKVQVSFPSLSNVLKPISITLREDRAADDSALSNVLKAYLTKSVEDAWDDKNSYGVEFDIDTTKAELPIVGAPKRITDKPKDTEPVIIVKTKF